MDIQIVVGTVTAAARTTCRGFLSAIYKSTPSSSSSSCLFSLSRRHFSSTVPRTICSSQEPPNRNGDSTNDKFSTDWDKAWTKFKKKGKKGILSQFSPNKYVTWNPRNSNFPLSEEVDPIKRTERSNLSVWTSSQFTLVGAIIIVLFLLLYTILAPVK
ncbi:hypothetical protein K2173_002118 [Erythroxylum novogranatense]|uniref:Transmembrane protein n=1 Tax=Erythroxylum novogranatense TaxID=1862640 RepID=A0AAV8SQH3_9ROSI|nr:hypothetical protein K2173_002118 [Erythroxylum novogranatense]